MLRVRELNSFRPGWRNIVVVTKQTNINFTSAINKQSVVIHTYTKKTTLGLHKACIRHWNGKYSERKAGSERCGK
jgi:hypothetical protein